MRAYLIAAGAVEPDARAACDALVVGARPSWRGEAIQEKLTSAAGAALDGFAPLAVTERGLEKGTPRLLLRVGGIDAPDLDAFLAGTTALRPDAIVLPAAHGRDVAHLGARLAVHEAEQGLADGGIGILVLIGCAAGVLSAATLAGASRRLRGVGWDAALAARLGAEALTAEGRWTPPLAQARATVRLAAAAAGVEAVEAAYPGDDPRRAIAEARRDGFAAMFARDPGQAGLIRAG